MVVTLETEKIEEVVQMMVITVTGSVSTTVEETEMMTVEAEVVAHEVTTVAAEMEAEMVAEMAEGLVAEMAEGLVAVQVVEVNLDSIETTAHQRAQVEVVDVVETTKVNLEIITTTDESACAASETGFDILQTSNAAYD